MRLQRPAVRTVSFAKPQTQSQIQGRFREQYRGQHHGHKGLRAVVVASGQNHNVSVRRAMPPPPPSPSSRIPTPPSNSFMDKLKAAWSIFFPPKPEQISSKEAGKSRLRMILVADRCGLNQASMAEMRQSIVKAVSDYVEIEAEDLIEVNISSEPEMGTVYSVAVPVRRVRPQARQKYLDGVESETDGVTLMWDEDPEDRFPYGC